MKNDTNKPKTSPLMQRYQKMRRSLPDDIILVVKIGDFYEAFDEGAKIMAETLTLALTKRHGVPMAGVPYHACDHLFAKLVEAGYRVAVANPTSPPKPGTPSEYEITEIVSKASLAPTMSEGDALRASHSEVELDKESGDALAEAVKKAEGVCHENVKVVLEIARAIRRERFDTDEDDGKLELAEVLEAIQYVANTEDSTRNAGTILDEVTGNRHLRDRASTLRTRLDRLAFLPLMEYARNSDSRSFVHSVALCAHLAGFYDFTDELGLNFHGMKRAHLATLCKDSDYLKVKGEVPFYLPDAQA